MQTLTSRGGKNQPFGIYGYLKTSASPFDLADVGTLYL